MKTNDTFLTSREVATLFGIHINTVKRLEIPYVRITNRGDRRYHPHDIEKYIQERIIR